MGKFFGTYERTLDAKRRLQLPAKLVREMPDRFYALRGFEGCLSIYGEEDFARLQESLSKLSYLDATARSYIRLASGSVSELEVDAHGRITISADLAAAYGIGQNVVIIGVLDHFEVWDAAAYQKYLSERSPSFENLASALAKNGERGQ